MLRKHLRSINYKVLIHIHGFIFVFFFTCFLILKWEIYRAWGRCSIWEKYHDRYRTRIKFTFIFKYFYWNFTNIIHCNKMYILQCVSYVLYVVAVGMVWLPPKKRPYEYAMFDVYICMCRCAYKRVCGMNMSIYIVSEV